VKVVGADKYRFEHVEPVDAEEAAARRAAIAAAQKTLAEAASVANRLANEVSSLQAQVKLAEQAKADHEKLSRKVETIGAVGSAEDAKAAVARAQERLDAGRRKRRADALHGEILVQTAVVKALAPDGVRKRKLSRAIEAFNSTILAPLCEAAEWKTVTLTEDLATRYGGRPYALLSDSEAYRVRVTLQIAMARLDDSAMVIIDGADILDPLGRNGLFGLLSDPDNGCPALVGMTVAKPEKTPDLAAADLGATYWVERGQCRAIGAAAKQEAA
jgi:hypothetical protein